MNQSPQSLLNRVLTAVTLVLVVAVGARLAWELLRPLIGPLVVLFVLLAIVGFVVRRGRW